MYALSMKTSKMDFVLARRPSQFGGKSIRKLAVSPPESGTPSILNHGRQYANWSWYKTLLSLKKRAKLHRVMPSTELPRYQVLAKTLKSYTEWIAPGPLLWVRSLSKKIISPWWNRSDATTLSRRHLHLWLRAEVVAWRTGSAQNLPQWYVMHREYPKEPLQTYSRCHHCGFRVWCAHFCAHDCGEWIVSALGYWHSKIEKGPN